MPISPYGYQGDQPGDGIANVEFIEEIGGV